MGPISNESFCEKKKVCGSSEQCMRPTEKDRNTLLQKKKRKKADTQVIIHIQTDTKSMVQTIPTYAIGCFKLPLDLCHNIEALTQKYFWGQQGDKSKIHWLKCQN